MQSYMNIAQIIISTALIGIILVQVRSSGLGSVFGGTDSAVYRTRRGLERTLFSATIGLSVVFFFITLANVIVSK